MATCSLQLPGAQNVAMLCSISNNETITSLELNENVQDGSGCVLHDNFVGTDCSLSQLYSSYQLYWKLSLLWLQAAPSNNSGRIECRNNSFLFLAIVPAQVGCLLDSFKWHFVPSLRHLRTLALASYNWTAHIKMLAFCH